MHGVLLYHITMYVHSNVFIEKAKRAAELQAKISNTLASKPGLLASVTEKMAL